MLSTFCIAHANGLFSIRFCETSYIAKKINMQVSMLDERVCQRDAPAKLNALFC